MVEGVSHQGSTTIGVVRKRGFLVERIPCFRLSARRVVFKSVTFPRSSVMVVAWPIAS